MDGARQMAPGIRRLRAPNPSPMTYTGTNTYLLGTGAVAVVDPGPLDDRHLDAILAALEGEVVEAILVTHAHLDHSGLAGPLSDRTGAPVFAYGDARAGRSARMSALSALGGGEGVDAGFRPDRELSDGEILRGADWVVEAIWTPGHFGNHLCYGIGDAILSGDLVMGWSTSIVSPPDGDLCDFLSSCEKLARRRARRLFPGHGDPIDDPSGRIAWLVDHRHARTDQILGVLRHGPADARAIAEAVYADLSARLLPAAERNVLAHLIALHDGGTVEPLDGHLARARFRLVKKPPLRPPEPLLYRPR